MVRTQRLRPDIFNLPVEKSATDTTPTPILTERRKFWKRMVFHPSVRMQVFGRNQAVLCGIDEAIAILKLCTGRQGQGGMWQDGWDALEVKALHDGDRISPHETVMTIEGDYATFAHLETCYLGVLSRRTGIASNAQKIVQAANGKQVLFFPARFDHHLVQTGDGYAAFISGAPGVSTDANAEWWGARGMGTVPHALIAAYGGNTVLATEKFAQYIDPEVKVISLVDFDNGCAGTSLAVARALGKRLWGVRLDTSSTLVDRSIWSEMGTFAPTGVNAHLVRNVRNASDRQGYTHVRIVVSGGFNAKKISAFERESVPADAYAVGSAFFYDAGAFDFTADIVAIRRDDLWQRMSQSWTQCAPQSAPASGS